jgi:predicted O-methyltransferase YrrM
MGLTFNRLDGSDGPSLLAPPTRAVLDLGTTNVYDCRPEPLSNLLKQHGVSSTPLLETWVIDFSRASSIGPEGQRLNAAFFSDLCSVLGIRYVSLDIFDGPNTIVVDLNSDPLPKDLHGCFDLVINSGTSEHIMNQFNIFRVIHDAAREGGQMFHVLPVSGHTDHGYVHYTSRFFFDLAGYNNYEIIELSYDSVNSSTLLDSARAYQTTFRAASEALKLGVRIAIDEHGDNVYGPEPAVPDASIIIRYKKTRSQPFVGALDAATSVGTISEAIHRRYQAVPDQALQDAAAGGYPNLTSDEHASCDRLLAGTASLEDALGFYRGVVARTGAFPCDWEARIVLLSLEREPNRPDLLIRLGALRLQMARQGIAFAPGFPVSRPPRPLMERLRRMVNGAKMAFASSPRSRMGAADSSLEAAEDIAVPEGTDRSTFAQIDASVVTAPVVAPFETLPMPPGLSYDQPWATIARLHEHREFVAAAEYFSRIPSRSLLSAVSQAHLYFAIRSLKPENVVEIGTYHAGTSECIARALASNGNGHLYTISPHAGDIIRANIAAWPDPLARMVTYHETDSAMFFQQYAESGRTASIYLIDGNHDFEYVLFDLLAAAKCSTSRTLIFMDNISQAGVYAAGKLFAQTNSAWELLGLSTADNGTHHLFDPARSAIPQTDFAVLASPPGPVIASDRCYLPGLRRVQYSKAIGLRLRLRQAIDPTRIDYQLILRETTSLEEKAASGSFVVGDNALEFEHMLDAPLVVSNPPGAVHYAELMLAVADARSEPILLADEPQIITGG